MNLARHYRTLGLRPGSSGREIKAAYRQLVRRYHPDINPDKQAVERFIKINDAYTAISEVTQARARRSHQYSTYSVHQSTTPPDSTHHKAQKTPSSQSTDQVEAAVQKNPAADRATATEQTPKATVEPLNLENLNVENLKRQLEKLGIGKFSSSQGTNIADSAKTQAKLSTDEQETELKQEAYLQLKTLLQKQKYPRAIALVEGLAHRMPSDAEISQWQAIVYQRWGRVLIDQGQTHKARIYLKKALRTDPNNPSLWSEVNRDFWQLANLGNTQEQPAANSTQ